MNLLKLSFLLHFFFNKKLFDKKKLSFKLNSLNTQNLVVSLSVSSTYLQFLKKTFMQFSLKINLFYLIFFFKSLKFLQLFFSNQDFNKILFLNSSLYLNNEKNIEFFTKVYSLNMFKTYKMHFFKKLFFLKHKSHLNVKYLDFLAHNYDYLIIFSSQQKLVRSLSKSQFVNQYLFFADVNFNLAQNNVVLPIFIDEKYSYIFYYFFFLNLNK